MDCRQAAVMAEPVRVTGQEQVRAQGAVAQRVQVSVRVLGVSMSQA